MSAESLPEDPRRTVVANLLREAHFRDPSEDVGDGFRTLAREILAAADAVITPPPDAVTKLREALKWFVGDSWHRGKPLTMTSTSDQLVIDRARAVLDETAAVVSPPPSPDDATHEKLRWALDALKKVEREKERLREALDGAPLSPPDTPTEYEQVGLLAFKEGDGFTVMPMGVPPEGDGWEPVFRRVRDDADAREAAAWEAALAEGDLGAGKSHKPPRRVRDENEKTK